MKIVRSLQDVTEPPPYPVLTVGSYDGIHCGHQTILRSVVGQARRCSGTAALLTFQPHPQKIISPADSPRLLQTFEQKSARLEALGVDLLVVVPFTWDLAQLSPRQFVTDIIHQRLGIREIHVGANFRFGHRREGDVAVLREMGSEFGIGVVEVAEQLVRGHRVSSPRIRGFLSRGHVEFARRMLGRPFSLVGRVVHGDGLGARIGIPTANLDVHNELIPQTGVYVTMTSIDGRLLPGVTNVGFRPTVKQRPSDSPVVETHLLDLDADIYGKDVELFFHWRVRPERKFSGIEELVRRIRQDIAVSRRYFARAGRVSGASSLDRLP
jgi:riboflavin kinase/FMN adenylyltransferase